MNIGSYRYSRRLPSVMTCSQSSKFCVIGHLNSAPDRFVLGCKFCPKGAPTSNLEIRSLRL